MAPFRIRVSSAAHSILSPQYHSCPCELLSSLALEWLALSGFNINAPLATTDGFISPLFRSPHSIKSLIFRKQFYSSILQFLLRIPSNGKQKYPQVGETDTWSSFAKMVLTYHRYILQTSSFTLY